MGNRIICIGRQFGSGGHEVAVRTAGRLGIPVYDKDILHLACQYGGLAVGTLEAADEKATNPYLYQTVHDGNYHVPRGRPTSEVLFELQSHEIRRIAARESCVFVGRCADYVLRAEPVFLLRVFISAPFERRVTRKAELEHLPRNKAKKLVTRMDKRRKKYYESYTGQTWGDPSCYDLNIDTSKTGLDGAADMIVSSYLEIG